MNEFETLLAGFIEDTLTAEDRQRLRKLLQSNREYREQYLEHCNLHAALAWEHGVLNGLEIPFETEPSIAHPATAMSPFRSGAWIRPLAWAAGLFIVFGLLWKGAIPAVQKSQWRSSESLGSFVVKAGGSLSLERLGIRLQEGDSIKVGDYLLTDGFTELVFENEVQILVEAPARFRVKSPLLMELYEGRLSANVSPEGVGFTVETPGADVIDHGTEFGVEVGPELQSEVHVFNGEVEVQSRDAAMESVRLFTDQATRVDRKSGEPSGITIAPERFIRSLVEPTRTYSQEVRELDPVAYYRMSVSDDGATLQDRSGNGYHGLIERGQVKASAFAAGRIGASLRLQGPSGQMFAKVNDYPKARENRLTVVAWVFAESRPRWASIAKNWAHGEIGQFHFGLAHDQGSLEVQLRDSKADFVFVQDSVPLPIGDWQHVAFVVDGQLATLYRNGVEVAKSACDGLAMPTFPSLGVGAKLRGEYTPASDGTMGFWDGRIDELSLFNKALSPDEIRTLYLSASVSGRFSKS